MTGKFVSGREIISPTMIPRSLASLGLAASYPGASVLVDDGQVYTSMRYPTFSDPYEWLSAAQIATDVAANVARFISSGTDLTVGAGGDYPTINAAIGYLLGFVNNSVGLIAPAKITILSGHTVAEQMLYQGIDMSWLQIEAQDAWVPVSNAAMVQTDPYGDTSRPLWGIYNVAAPIINCGFDFSAGAVSNIAGLVARASRILSLPYDVSRPLIGFRGNFANGYILRSACSGRIDSPTVENHTAIAVEVRGRSTIVLTGGSYRSATVGARSVVSAGNFAIGLQVGATEVDLRRVAGVNNATDIQVTTGGAIAFGAAPFLGGTSQPINVQTDTGTIYQSLAVYRSYGTSNILGTVSQAAGVPTGAIIQRGSNANGNFIRFADGTQICNLIVSMGSITAAGAGTLASAYRTSPYSWTFPIAFSSEPICNLSLTSPDAWAIDDRVLVTTSNASPTTTSWSSVRGSRVGGGATANTIIGSFLAIGRWF